LKNTRRFNAELAEHAEILGYVFSAASAVSVLIVLVYSLSLRESECRPIRTAT